VVLVLSIGDVNDMPFCCLPGSCRPEFRGTELLALRGVTLVFLDELCELTGEVISCAFEDELIRPDGVRARLGIIPLNGKSRYERQIDTRCILL